MTFYRSTGPIKSTAVVAKEDMVGELIVNMFVTLDGVVQAPGEPSEDVEGGFEHGGRQAPYLDEESGGVMFEDMAHLDALLLGRKTYEIIAAYWPQGPEEIPFTALLNNVPKYVASRTLESVEWNNSNLIQGEIANEVPRLKEQYGQIHVSGSADLVQTLATPRPRRSAQPVGVPSRARHR